MKYVQILNVLSWHILTLLQVTVDLWAILLIGGFISLQ